MDRKLLIIGVNGMLGNCLFKYFIERTNIRTYGLLRNKKKILNFFNHFNSERIIEKDFLDIENLDQILSDVSPNIILNCIGIVKQNPLSNDPLCCIKVNSIFPHLLNKLSLKFKARLIHFSTDCVFSGLNGNYFENDFADANDIYGRSKFLGEISNNGNITLRTSFIGKELGSNRALLNWFLSQKGKIKGYKNAIYSGLTTLEVAKVLDKYVIPNPDLRGLYHLSGENIDKYSLLSILNEVYKKDLIIEEDREIRIDRSLNSYKFRKETGYKPLKWNKAIQEMMEFGEI